MQAKSDAVAAGWSVDHVDDDGHDGDDADDDDGYDDGEDYHMMAGFGKEYRVRDMKVRAHLNAYSTTIHCTTINTIKETNEIHWKLVCSENREQDTQVTDSLVTDAISFSCYSSVMIYSTSMHGNHYV